MLTNITAATEVLRVMRDAQTQTVS